jgi:hypothetical protein
MLSTSDLRSKLLIKYPQFKPKFSNTSSQEYLDELARIDVFIEDSRVEVPSTLENQYDIALIELTCHYLTKARSEGYSSGQITHDERPGQNTVIRYASNTIKNGKHSDTKYGATFDGMISEVKAAFGGGFVV